MTAAKSRKGKKAKKGMSKETEQLKHALQPPLRTGWLDKKVKALRKEVGIPREGFDIPPEGLDHFMAEFEDGCLRDSVGQPPEKNRLYILQEGVKRIMKESDLTDQVWFEFFLGYVVGCFKGIDDMPTIPVGRAYISTGRFGPEGEVETVIRLRGIPTVREMHRLLRTLRNIDAIWRRDWVSPRQREDARIYEQVETPWTWLDDSEKWPDKFTKEDAKRAIACERIHDRYAPFVDPQTGLPEELDREYHRVCNAYDREKERREPQGD